MDAVKDVYQDLETDVSFEEFEAKVKEKVNRMGGLADEKTAATLIGHELDAREESDDRANAADEPRESDSSEQDYDIHSPNAEQETHAHLSKSDVLTRIREMNPYQFEELVAKIWDAEGWETRVTSGSGDRGVDILATKADTFDERRHAIQVKRYGENAKVGSKEMQGYSGLYSRRDDEPDSVFVVTSNRFTKEAEQVAKNRGVKTIDCDELYERLTETVGADVLSEELTET